MGKVPDGYVRVGTLAEVAGRGSFVMAGRHCPILVIHHAGQVYAVDNRCPHLGFPLERGSVEDGILTCHWHHARFDLASGGTFDLWADDVPCADVQIHDGAVFVSASAGAPRDAQSWRVRLWEAMSHDLDLVSAKAILGALSAGATPGDLVSDAVLFGAANRDRWGTGLTILTALANTLPELPDESIDLALYHGITRVAQDCVDQPPRRPRPPLPVPVPDQGVDAQTLSRWLRRWVQVRHRSAAERTLQTAVAAGLAPVSVAEMLLTAATDRAYADGGHLLDFVNKALECLDRIGWKHAGEILPALVGDLVSARGGEEMNAWRHPVDLVPVMESAFQALPDRLARGSASGASWAGHDALAEDVLGDDPHAIVAAIDRAIDEGAAPSELGRALALAAARRVARFGTANEFSDWNTAHHSFTYANAVHRALVRLEGSQRWEPVRGVYHGAMALYLNRFLNIPPARIPAGAALDALPADAEALLARLLDLLDRQKQVDAAAAVAARYLSLGLPVERLIGTLSTGLLREDVRFHVVQSFEAALSQFRAWNGEAPGDIALLAFTRFLAAHSPTDRAESQTADIARRLHRGGRLHEEADDAG